VKPARNGVRQVILAVACLLAITASAVWIYFSHFAKPGINLLLHQEVGRTLAAETAKLLTNQGKVVIIALDEPRFPELKAEVKAFEDALRKTGLTIKERYMLETDNKSKFGLGSGLSGRRYVRIVNKNQSADAFVSFVGAADLSGDEIKELKITPKLVAETRSADNLPKLFKKKLIHVAVVSRFTFPAPIEGRPRDARQWFDKYRQVVTADTAKQLLGVTD
jgi:hypothetical protein